MRKPNTARLQLATSNAHWAEVNNRISDAVSNLCDDHNKAEALMLIVDLMTNGRYAPGDRENVVAEVQQQTFKYTRGFDDLLRGVIEKINPMPRKLAKVG